MNPEQELTIIEITATLEQIQRTNQMLAYHKQFDDVDRSAVENFERLRKGFLQQLTELMRKLDIDATLHTHTVY